MGRYRRITCIMQMAEIYETEVRRNGKLLSCKTFNVAENNYFSSKREPG